MNPGDLVILTGVARLYITLDYAVGNSKNLNEIDRDILGILLKKKTEEFTEEDIDNLGFGSHVWDVYVNGRVEKVWEIDIGLINNVEQDSTMLDLDNLPAGENLRHLSRAMRILNDGRFK